MDIGEIRSQERLARARTHMSSGFNGTIAEENDEIDGRRAAHTLIRAEMILECYECARVCSIIRLIFLYFN